MTSARKHTKNDLNVTPHPLPKLKRPLYARLKEMGEFFPVVLWPLVKERKTLCLQIIGGLFILASIVGFRSDGMLWPMLGSAVGTGFVILGWERTREKLAALQEDHLTSNQETAESRDRRQLDLFAGGNEIMSEYPPGVWEDHEGTLHFDIATLLQHLNLLDTPENRAALEEELRATIKEKSPKEKPEA